MSPLQDIFLLIYRIESDSIIHPPDGLAHSETEPGEETTTQYAPHYGVVQASSASLIRRAKLAL